TAAAGARLLVALAPATVHDAGLNALRARLATFDIPTIDLGDAVAHFAASTGRSGFLPGRRRWDADGHFIASEAIWAALQREHLLPASIVPARALGAGLVPELDRLPQEFVETLWRARHALFSRFIQLGLLCVAILWAGACLPVAGRDWLLAAVSLG